MGRGMQLAMLGGIVVGSVSGGMAALAVSAAPAATAAAPVAPSAVPVAGSAVPVASVVTAAAPAAPALPTADSSAAPSREPAQPAIVSSIAALLTRFAHWAHSHPGEPCPDAAALGSPAIDPWGHPLELTCTDQPADQRIGAISAGPDGIAGTDDDIESWSLGRDVTEIVRGPRWKSAQPGKPTAVHRRPRHPEPSTTPASSAPPSPTAAAPTPPVPPPVTNTDDIPSRR